MSEEWIKLPPPQPPFVDDTEQEEDTNIGTHIFHLRPTLRVALVGVPDDLSKHEAERLAAWVRTLPLG